MKKALSILGVIVLLALAGLSFYAIRFLGTSPSVGDEAVVFEVKPGESFKTVARHLEDQGLVTSARNLELYTRFARTAPKVRVGEYALRRNFKPREIMSVLTSGKSIEYPITIPEGSNRFEIAEIVGRSKVLSRDEFLRLTTDKTFIDDALGAELSVGADSLEGFLFPETYHLTKYTGSRGFIHMMIDRFKATYAKVKATPGWSRGSLTDRQLVAMASIIEKETMAPEERPVVASVFYNRMRINMPLQTDPTLIYALYLEKGSWDGVLPRDLLKRPGPYNSYLNHGLPPGPIGNPGFEALKAAGMPAKTEYMYFMSRNNGTHTFSKDYSQHAKAVSTYWQDRRTETTKSWRDVNKREATPEKVFEAPKTKSAPADMKVAPGAGARSPSPKPSAGSAPGNKKPQ